MTITNEIAALRKKLRVFDQNGFYQVLAELGHLSGVNIEVLTENADDLKKKYQKQLKELLDKRPKYRQGKLNFL